MFVQGTAFMTYHQLLSMLLWMMLAVGSLPDALIPRAPAVRAR